MFENKSYKIKLIRIGETGLKFKLKVVKCLTQSFDLFLAYLRFQIIQLLTSEFYLTLKF